MSIFTIADTHLSFGTNKPMDNFEGWNNYTQRLKENWDKVVEQRDFVVIVGDISWAMNFDELYADFDFLNKLNGNKIIIKGNHDYWWNTMAKMKKFIDDNGFNSIQIVNNSSVEIDNYIVCGSRGWLMDFSDEHDEKIYKREVMRIKNSLDFNNSDKEKIVFLHYPPVTSNSKSKEIIDLLEDYGIKNCYYGHLHGVAAKFAFEGTVNGINFKLVSCDRLGFTPLLVKKF